MHVAGHRGGLSVPVEVPASLGHPARPRVGLREQPGHAVRAEKSLRERRGLQGGRDAGGRSEERKEKPGRMQER